MGFCAAVTMQGQIWQAEVEGFLRERDSSADDVTPLCFFSCMCVPLCHIDTTAYSHRQVESVWIFKQVYKETVGCVAQRAPTGNSKGCRVFVSVGAS